MEGRGRRFIGAADSASRVNPGGSHILTTNHPSRLFKANLPIYGATAISSSIHWPLTAATAGGEQRHATSPRRRPTSLLLPSFLPPDLAAGTGPTAAAASDEGILRRRPHKVHLWEPVTFFAGGDSWEDGRDPLPRAGDGGGEEADRSSLSAPAASFGEVPLLEEEDAPPVTVRQRSMHLNASFSITGIGGGNPKGYTALALAVDGGGAAAGMSHSDSRAKLEADSELGKAAVLKTTFYILVWYTFSTCLTMYNKTLLGDDLGKFPAPLLMNTVHFSLQAVLSNIVVWRQESKATMSWRDYLIRVVPTAVGTALDINLSNVSLVFISVTFATMCKSSSPIFLLVFAFAFRLESPSIKLLGIILIISLGVLLTVAKETEFEFWGFVLVMLASVTSGFRWSMTQILLQKEAYGLKNPLTLMSYVAPVMAIVTAGLSLVMDPWKEFHSNAYFNNTWHTMRSLLLMLIGGMLAFFMVLTEYVLVSATSAVTVMIAGVVKEAVTILVAVLYFHDEFSLLKGIGLMVIMIGVGLFNIYKYQKQQKGLGNNSEEEAPSIPNGAAKYVIFDEIDSEEEGI